MYKYLVNLVIVFLLTPLSLLAQLRTIQGTVKDGVNQESMPGVTVHVKGTTRGVTTDGNGEFSISVSPGDSIEFNFVGKRPITEVVGNRNILEIIMFDDDGMIEELVVTAFGRARRANVATSITAVNVRDLRVPASNFTSALAGNVAGVISFQPTGEPGADNAQFFIRGVTSFGYAQQPLILIDGFESSADDLARLQIDDIESFSVLKDAAAAVMYGARSANGIITITTKSGREGRQRISFRYDANYATPTQRINFLDGVTYMHMYNEAQETRNPMLGSYYNAQKIMMTERGEYPMIFPNIDWYEDMFNKGTWNHRANLNVSGGGPIANYFISGGIENETGLLKVDQRNNFNNNINIVRTFLRSNVTFKLSRTTTLDTRVTARFERYTGPFTSASDLYTIIMNSNPVDFPPVYEPDLANADTEHVLFGSTILTGAGIKANPYAQMVMGFDDRNETFIVAQATLNQELDFIVPGLSMSLKASADTYSKYSSRRRYYPYYYALQSFNQATGEYTLFPLNESTGNAFLSDVSPDRDAGSKYYFEGIIRWAGSYGPHSVGAQLVGTATENLYGGGSTSIYETLPEKNLVAAGRFNYDYDQRYFTEFTFGYNGSEKFTGEKQYALFPAVAGAWMISNESFFEGFKATVPMLKLKASWGLGGNDAIGRRDERFRYMSHIDIGGDPFASGYRWGSNFMNAYGGYAITRYANPEITWERSAKTNLGFEVGLLRNEAITLQVELFQEKRSQIYWPRENFPATAGLSAGISGNVGKVDARGVDGQLVVQHYFNRFMWVQGRANFTYGRNKIVDIDERLYPDVYLRRKGAPVRQEWGLIAERLFIDEAEIINSPRQDFGEYMAGDIKYKDVNDDGVVDDNDRVSMGFPTTPEMQYGFGLSMGYRNFDFSFFMQGNARVSIFINPSVGGGSDGNEGIAPFVGFRNALPIVADNYWSETNPDPHAFWPRLSTIPLYNNIQQSSWWMRNGSFMRLKNVEVGYNVPNIERAFIENFRIYFTVENAYVWSRFKLWDPEMGRRGLAYPPNRRFNLGVKLDF